VAEKTEDPTPRRQKKAREEGEAPISVALTQALAFVVAVALVRAAVAAAAARVATLVPQAIDNPASSLVPTWLPWEVLTLCGPLLLGIALVAATTGFVQTGGAMGWKRISPDLSKLNPIRGLGSLFSTTRALSLLRALIGAAVVAWLALRLLTDFAPSVANTAGDPSAGIAAAGGLVRRLGWIAALVGIALAGVDVLVVRRSWLKRHRMSKDEVKREHRETEGDPELKAARQRAYQEMLASATLSAVRQATVIVVNPTHLATALSYDEGEDEAPRVVARGEGELARRMLTAAQQWGIPIVRDVPLARALAELSVGDEIPEALYEAVAEVLREAWEDTP